MNSLSATALLLLLTVVLFAPLAVAAHRNHAPAWMIVFYPLILLGIGVSQLGFMQGYPAPPADTPSVSRGSLSGRQCAEILSLLDEGGVVVDRRHPPRVVVVEQLWLQLPEEGRDAVLSCVQQSWPAGAGTPQLETR